MSAPAAKAFSLPVRTMAPMVSSSSYFFRASLSSVKRAEERALRARGRFSVTVRKLEYQHVSNRKRSWGWLGDSYFVRLRAWARRRSDSRRLLLQQMSIDE